MRKRILCLGVGALLFALSFPAEAQQPGKIPWIGYLTGSGSSPNQAFVQGMRDLGYVEGEEYRFCLSDGGG